jgi:hypothetical protein
MKIPPESLTKHWRPQGLGFIPRRKRIALYGSNRSLLWESYLRFTALCRQKTDVLDYFPYFEKLKRRLLSQHVKSAGIHRTAWPVRHTPLSRQQTRYWVSSHRWKTPVQSGLRHVSLDKYGDCVRTRLRRREEARTAQVRGTVTIRKDYNSR